MSSLFIAGNGFDIAHGIPTQYSEFRAFIIQKYPEALELRDEVVYLEDFEKIDPNEFAAEILLNAMDKAAGENWCNFEDALAYINFDNKFPLPNHKENETDEEDQMLMQQYLLYMDMLISGFINCSKICATQGYSYDFALYQAIKSKKSTASKAKAKQEELKKYIFIIDEINRGEISKIFGELFFAIDPGYRGKAGEISTQYSNLHSDPGEKFYIPENVYIIGTMNDIDRSVDSFDFAMRRRFRFVELRADERLEMLASLENEELEAEAIRRMAALNKAIAEVEDLNENYQIGASYFLKLKTLDFDQLWTDYLQPLLQEYIQGMYDEEGIMNRFARAYGYQKPARGDANEATQDQG